MKLVIPFQRFGSLLALAILLAVSVGTYFHLERLENAPTVDVPVEKLPKQLGRWRGTDTKGLDIRSQEILKLTRYVKRTYQRPDGRSVTLYIGYWQEQSGDYQAAKHSPLLCLPSNGWDVRHKEAIDLSFDGEGLMASEVNSKRIIGEIGNQSYLFYYWFFTGLDNYSQEWRALVNISLQKFFYGRSDGGIIEISTPLKAGVSRQAAEEDAAEVIEDFLSELYPALRKLIVHSTSSENARSAAVRKEESLNASM